MIAIRVLHHLPGQRRHQRQHQNGLRQHHGLEAEQPPQKAQRPRAGQQQVDHQTHHHRRDGQKGVEDGQDHASPGKAGHREPGTEQQADAARDQAGGGADRE